ncbi:16S rRNA (cytosine(967)-C(5))-methyltransferase [hydrothermal vent metagenome]|uniref:16S rRNA (cytosine(967)-C(5))-methyltransferase n=1 Tax=hydrothermal vent metagenome TaxID=652676 RepID=A0A3B1AQ73_9ZZZZ
MKNTDPRALAAKTLARVVNGASLTAVLDDNLPRARDNDRALIQELCYGTLRAWPRLEHIAGALLRKPLGKKDRDVQALILLGLHQLTAMRIPAHAAVAETVGAVSALGKGWARGLLNAVLRNFQRQRETLLAQADDSEPGRWAHPQWLIDTLRQAWPDDWQQILAANNERAPMTLRVNTRRQSRSDYLSSLEQAGIGAEVTTASDCGIRLRQAVDVSLLPGFAGGTVSVQDEAAQLAVALLDAQPGERVLDVCAAPGGKTAHILEHNDNIELLAVDIEAKRLQRVTDNLQRLGLTAVTCRGDARQPQDWWDGHPFDRILLDAPCSATGVIRRHPDIKLLRRPGDIETLLELQGEILHAIWPLLRTGGILLYATCSVLPQENERRISTFIAERPDAEHRDINADWGRTTGIGRQILPGGTAQMDGFYYACLHKRATACR